MSSSTAAPRVGWVDLAKGIGIILIVIGHANRSIDRSPLLEWTDALRLIDYVLYSFHVPLFFFLAGVSAGLARRGLNNAVQSLILGVVFPYVVWSVIWIVSKSSLPTEVVNQPLEFSALLRIFVMPVDHFWFLYHLALIRILWLAADFSRSERGPMVLLGMLAAATFVSGALGDEWAFMAHFFENAVFFGIGLAVMRRTAITLPSAAWSGVIATFVFVVLLVVSRDAHSMVLNFLTSIAGVLAVVCATIYICQDSTNQTWDMLRWIGRASLVIFLLHVFAIGVVRFLLSKTGMLSNMSLLIVGSVAGVILPLMAYVFVDRLSAIRRQPIMTWIGWGRWRQPAEAQVSELR